MIVDDSWMRAVIASSIKLWRSLIQTLKRIIPSVSKPTEFGPQLQAQARSDMVLNFIKLVYELLRCTLDLIFLFLYSIWNFLISPITFLFSFQQKSLKNQVVLITGSAAGIGRATCLELARLEKTISLICWDMSTGPNESLMKELERMGIRRAVAMTVDVTKEVEVQAAYKQACIEVGQVTMLINNAGISSKWVPLWELESSAIEKVIAVNLTSHFYILKAVLPDMIARGKGHIVTNCSILGHLWYRYTGPYVATKFGVRGYVECLKEDVRACGRNVDIKFTTVYPQAVRTNIMADVDTTTKYEFMESWMTPEFVAKALVKGVRRNQEHLFVPGFGKAVAWFMATTPPSIIRMTFKIFDVKESQKSINNKAVP